MNRYLLGKLEDETPDVLDKIGCQKQGRGVLGLFLVAFFALFLNGAVWAADPLVDGGVYLIKCKNWNDYYLYPNNNFMRVVNSLDKNRYWVATKVVKDNETFYTFRNFDEEYLGVGTNSSSKGIYLVSNLSLPANNNAIKHGNFNPESDAFLFKLVARSGSYAVIPYELKNTKYSWFLDATNNSLGLKEYDASGVGNKVLWDFVSVTPRFDLISPDIDISAPITEAGEYEIARGSSQCLLLFGAHQYSVLSNNGGTNNTTYSLSYEGTLPTGTSIDDSDNSKWIVTVSTLPNPAVTVVLTCSVTRRQLGNVVVQEDYRFPIVIGQATHITSLANLGSNGCYILDNDIENASGYTTLSTFTGIFDGQNHTIKGLTVPLFGTMTNAVVHNVNLENVVINETRDSDNTGTIAKVANGASRIYNVGILSGSVGGTGNTGGLVGLLDGTSRVINCFSYADITSGTVKAGIVGYNNYASKYYDLRTMVMNCMFYGDIAEGNSIYPIYGGLSISNDYNKNDSGTANKNNRLNNYNYFLYEADFSIKNRITQYNCALAAEERFLVRFEFYRYLLNSTRELAAWYATGNANNGFGVGSNNIMLKWVLDKTIAPYPILKQQGTYPSVVNYDPDNTFDSETGQMVSRTSNSLTGTTNKGKNLGSLTVNISLGSDAPSGAAIRTGMSQITLQRTDKDFDDYNFNYDKVQLPYYNEVGTGNCTHNKAVTGWKITSMTNGTQGTFTASDTWGGYNFADREHYAKDLFGTSGRVFSQGGYFNVPEGVTAINIEPYWANAVYLSDACYDRYGYGETDDAVDNLTQVGGGQRYTNGSTYSINGDPQKVYTTIGNALGQLSNASSVYDNAVVLVGNYHHSYKIGGGAGDELASNKDKAFTIMSIDLNEDNEPDYSLIFRTGKQKTVSPIRYDFINVPAMAMAHKMASHGDLAIPGNCKPLGWFELTTTAMMRFNQFEYDSESKKINDPIIFMGGVIEQFVSTNGNLPNPWRTKYLLFGDNVWFKVCSNGCHMEKTYGTPHIPISVTGGDFEEFYLSGYFSPKAVAANDDAEGYIDGGRFGVVAGAGQEEVKGDVTWLIDHADIDDFYAGGVNAAKAIKGDISTTIKNSRVGVFCGGPKFGDMASTKTIGVTATDCTFGTYFGAGFGGTSSYRHQVYNVYQQLNYTGDASLNSKMLANYTANTRGYYKVSESDDIDGILYDYEYELFGGSTGNVHRLYMLYASFSLAQTNNASSTLTDCMVTGNYYGGGSLGAVNGNVTSTLTNTTVLGSVFGGGYSVKVPKVGVRELGSFNPEPYYNETTGVYVQAGFPDTVQYQWSTVESLTSGNNALNNDNHTIKTVLATSGLGVVSGDVTITLEGNTTVGTLLPDGTLKANTGNVFGGGDESAVTGTTTVYLQGTTQVYGNVYGGGNKGKVDGDSKVFIQDEPEP